MNAFDSLGEWGEKKLGQAEKAAGKAIHKGAEIAAEGLDKVGLHGAARKVDHAGEAIASSLGAEVGEHQLGQSENPKDLVHGEPKRIEATAKHLRSLHSSFNATHSALQQVRATDWKGEGADAFTTKFVEQPKKWAEAADAFEAAAGVLDSYAHTVTWAQNQAKEAIRLWKRGQETNKKAFDDYKAKVHAYNAKIDNRQEPGPKPVDPGNPGDADMKEAQRLLSEARKQRNTAAAEAQTKIASAVSHAPEKPSFTNRMKANALDLKDGGAMELMHFEGGVLRSGTDAMKLARGLNPLDIYNVTHPADYLSTVSNTAAGMLSLASHPERLPATLVGEGWGKDPYESGGRFLGNVGLAVATGGGSAGAAAAERTAIAAAERGAASAAERAGAAGAESAGARAGSRAGQEAAESAEQNAARTHVNDNPQEPARPKNAVESGETDPVDLATGKMFLPQTDVLLPGALPLSFVRHVRSGYQVGRWLGPSWASTADQRLEIDSEGVVFVCEDGMLLSYPHPVPGVPTLPTHGPRRPLSRTDDGGYAITDPISGRTSYFAPYDDGLALLEQISDRNGHWITFEYEADGTPTAIAHSAGQRIAVTTESGRITALHLVGAAADGSNAEMIRYGYTDGDLTDIVNSSGKPLRFGYDERGRVTSWTDRNGSHYSYTYDDQDRCVFEGGAAGHMRVGIEYGEPDPESGLRTTTLTNALGHTWHHVFNDALQPVAQTDPLGATTLMRWDRRNHLLSRTDPLGRTTEYRYDVDGRLTTVVRPDGREATATYNALGLPETVTAFDGSAWHHTYDGSGNRTSATDPAGAVTQYTYDEAGHPASVTDALGNTSRVRCDASGLVTEVVDPLDGVTSYRRDGFGRVTAVIDPLGAMTRMQWSVEGRLLRRVDPDGAEQSWTYDGEGNSTAHTDALGNVTTYEYTHFDKLAAQTGPDGVRYEFTHDPLLQLTRVTNPQGLEWSYSYDPAGRLTVETDFDGRTLTYAHDPAGRLTSRTNALGQTIAYDHDVLGRVVAKDADGVVTTYAHDAAGRLLEAVGPDATLTYSRDRLGRVKSETMNGRTLTFAYDLLGRRTRRVTPGGAVSTWAYDAAGRRTSLTASGHVFDIEHDAAGREIARHFGEGVTLTHEWDAAGRLTSQTLAGTEEHLRRNYTYRRDGHLTAVDDRTFELDTVGRVTTVTAPGWQERYAYDDAGNQTDAAWPSDHPGTDAQGPRTYTGTRITRAGGIRYEHDEQGRVVLRQKVRLSRKPDTWRYEWDAEDRLRSVITPDGARWRYLYDPLGRRIAKQRLDESGGVLEQADFTWDGPTLTEQTTVSSDLPNPVTLTWDHDGLRPVAQTERISAADASQAEIDSRFFAIVTDLVGTPSELVDESGDIAWRTRTTLWGTTTWASDSTAYTPLRFPGQYYDPETGLHYNFHRYYDPETARYASADPLGLAAAPNPVAYVRNPLTGTDSLGLAPECGQNAPQRGPFDMRGPNPDHPPNQGAVEIMNNIPLGGNLDCSEIAEWILKDSGGEGKIINFTSHSDPVIRVPESGGAIIEEYRYHDVYTDGRYVYDPAFGESPVPLGDYKRALRLINPGKKILTNEGGYSGPLW
ncbi:putative T7SS-secreted protein [Streptomyces sp. NPDC037389]|uniref:putative T7SS-secreted protein n=1 Tax=Streptomyces sp. NPDC037389 TaxID=3155369 RepID=UPI0033C5C2E0